MFILRIPKKDENNTIVLKGLFKNQINKPIKLFMIFLFVYYTVEYNQIIMLGSFQGLNYQYRNQ